MENKGRILVVDDTLASLKLMADTLKAEGYEVYATDNGELALGAAHSKCPELILCDMRMPGLDGVEVCRRLKASEATRHIPLMFISAATATEDRVQGFAVGAVDFVSKPFQRDELLARVHTHLELARLRHQLERRVAERTAELSTARTQLEEALVQVKEMNEQLEDRVIERTSELGHAHLKLRTTARQLAQTERTAALLSMMNGLARELAVPIECSMKAAQRLQHGIAECRRFGNTPILGLDDDATALLHDIGRAAEVVQEFAALAVHRHAEQRSRFTLQGVVGEALAGQLSLLKDSRHQLRLEISPELMLNSYPRALAQVLSHLLSNALRHAFSEGQCGEILVSAADEVEVLVLSVADNGCGIATDHLPHIFDPFFTGDRSEQGRGLGLSLAYSLTVDVLGGSLRANNLPEGGAIFTLRLPHEAPQAQSAGGAHG